MLGGGRSPLHPVAQADSLAPSPLFPPPPSCIKLLFPVRLRAPAQLSPASQSLCRDPRQRPLAVTATMTVLALQALGKSLD